MAILAVGATHLSVSASLDSDWANNVDSISITGYIFVSGFITSSLATAWNFLKYIKL
jgi:hypothetical protein